MLIVMLIIWILVLWFFLVAPKRKEKKMAPKIAAGEVPAVQNTKTRHVVGLPVPEGAPCFVQVYTNRVAFLSASKRFEVPVNRITEATMYTDTEMRQHIQSSLFQTMLGGAAFGGAGAVVGAMPHSKYKREIAKYNLMVSFKAKDGSDSAIVVTCDDSLKDLAKAIHPEGNEPGDDRVVEL